ncbi:MAG: Asp-tRNA(Asn)/Glu-tRNA(Gln) amidotransferase subunit GatC [bacterium]
MKLTPDTVRRMARLAGIQVDADELDHLADELGRILDYMERLRETELEDSRNPGGGDAAAGTREDEPVPSVDREEALAQAPDREGPFFRVPPVLPPRAAGREDET